MLKAMAFSKDDDNPKELSAWRQRVKGVYRESHPGAQELRMEAEVGRGDLYMWRVLEDTAAAIEWQIPKVLSLNEGSLQLELIGVVYFISKRGWVGHYVADLIPARNHVHHFDDLGAGAKSIHRRDGALVHEKLNMRSSHQVYLLVYLRGDLAVL